MVGSYRCARAALTEGSGGARGIAQHSLLAPARLHPVFLAPCHYLKAVLINDALMLSVQLS